MRAAVGQAVAVMTVGFGLFPAGVCADDELYLELLSKGPTKDKKATFLKPYILSHGPLTTKVAMGVKATVPQEPRVREGDKGSVRVKRLRVLMDNVCHCP